MVDEEEENQDDVGGAAVFVVRLSDAAEADFAVCERIGTVPGSRRLPSGKTVAELVGEQGLMAAAVPEGDHDGLRDLAFLPQSGHNISGPND